MPQSTPEGKRVLWEVSTGRQVFRWPVDARGMLETGEFTDQPPAGAEAATSPPPAPPAPPAPEPLPTEYSPGVPLVFTRAHEAAPSGPLQEPVRTKGKRRA